MHYGGLGFTPCLLNTAVAMFAQNRNDVVTTVWYGVYSICGKNGFNTQFPYHGRTRDFCARNNVRFNRHKGTTSAERRDPHALYDAANFGVAAVYHLGYDN